MDLDYLLSGKPQHQLQLEDLRFLYEIPITRLSYFSQKVTQVHHADHEVQMCTLLSVKTGGCKEDCSYCPQSAHHKSKVDAHGLLDVDTMVEAAKQAKESGSTRFCMGAAWRSPPKKGPQFDKMLDTIKQVSSMGLEVCTTLGMINEEQAVALKDAGVYTGPIDGSIGGGTMSAVARYQKENNMAAGGLTINVLEKLGVL